MQGVELATHAEVGLWLAIFFGTAIAAVTLAHRTRQLWISFNPPPKSRDGDEAYVTRKELADAFKELEDTIKGLVGRSEYEQRHADLEKRVDLLNEYLHQRVHDLLGNLQTIMNKLDILSQTLAQEVGRREGLAAKTFDPTH